MVRFLSLYENTQITRSALSFLSKEPLKQTIYQFYFYLKTLQHFIINVSSQMYLHWAVTMSPLCTSITTNPFLPNYGKQLIAVEALWIFPFRAVGCFLTTVGFSGFIKTQIASVDLLSTISVYLLYIFQYKHIRFRDYHWHWNVIIFSNNPKSKGLFLTRGTLIVSKFTSSRILFSRLLSLSLQLWGEIVARLKSSLAAWLKVSLQQAWMIYPGPDIHIHSAVSPPHQSCTPTQHF